jgi:D-alanyl-D-alanine carboxypeptidase
VALATATIAALTAIVAAPVEVGEAAPPRWSHAVSAGVKQVIRQNSIPGAIVGVWQQGRRPYVKAFGIRNKATRRKMQPGLYMRIGSETKTFTATAVLQLVDQGKVGLDDPISKYIEGVPNGDAITIRNLAEMRSGLVSYTAVEAWDQRFLSDPQRRWKPTELLAYGFSQPPA